MCDVLYLCRCVWFFKDVRFYIFLFSLFFVLFFHSFLLFLYCFPMFIVLLFIYVFFKVAMFLIFFDVFTSLTSHNATTRSFQALTSH